MKNKVADVKECDDWGNPYLGKQASAVIESRRGSRLLNRRAGSAILPFQTRDPGPPNALQLSPPFARNRVFTFRHSRPPRTFRGVTMSNPFFDQPILNSPYECPRRHWELDPHGQPTQQVLESRRPSAFLTPIPK